MGLNKSAQVKFGFYFIIITVLLLAFAAAQEKQADQNGPQKEQQAEPAVQPEPPQEPSADQNLPPLGTNGEPAPQIELPAVKIISPVFGETVSGTGVVITAISPKEKITSAFFDVGGIKKDLPQENNFSGDFNSQELLDGNYEVKATACIGEACQSDAVPITVSNPQSKAQEEPTAEQQNFVFLAGSNVFSALTVFDSGNGIVASGTENVKVLAGKYRLQIDFPEALVSKIMLSSADMQSDMNVTEIQSVGDLNSISMPDKNFEWLDFTTIKTNAPFDSGQVSFSPAGKQDALFSCSDWDFAENKCRLEFEKFFGVSQSTVEETLPSQNAAFGFARQLQIEIVPDINSDAFDNNSLKIKQKKFGKRLLKLTKEKINFSANDTPAIGIEISDENGSRTDEDFNAFLVFPDGTQEQIGQENIERLERGQYRIKAKMPRSFHAGTYQIKMVVQSETGPIEESQPFEWGLLAVNTNKSIYRPGETADFQIAVLDRESFGVPDATVTISIAAPSGETKIISTLDGTITETTSTGIYVASVKETEEGEYKVQAQATAPQIDTKIETNFFVFSDYNFDIIRNTATKIDPLVKPVKVDITVTSLKSGQKNATIREVVPKEFEVSSKILAPVKKGGEDTIDFVDDPNFEVQEIGSYKLLEWKKIDLTMGQPVVLTYEYSVPDKKPWLYLIGPAEISDKKLVLFTEYKSWMVAVDANPTSKLFFRDNLDGNVPIEPRPNDKNCGSGCGISAYVGSVTSDVNGMSDNIGVALTTKALSTGTTKGILNDMSFVSFPLAPQTLTTNGTWIASMFCKLNNVTNNTSQVAFAVYRWIASTDSNGQRLTPFFITAACTTSTAIAFQSQTGTPSSVAFNRGDKLIVEADINVANTGGAVTGRTMTFTFNDISLTGDSNLTFPSGVSARFSGDLNTGIVSPANNSTNFTNTAFDVNVLGSCRNYSCGDTNVSLKYCFNPSAGCSTFYDMNTVSSSPLYVSTGVAFRQDNILDAKDTNYFVLTVTATDDNTYTIRSSIDSNWSTDVNNSSKTNSDVNITINLADPLGFAVSLPSSGCTAGKGRFAGQGNGACQRGYFETTDLSGTAGESKVNAEGQTSAIPFFVYDNQSTTSSDINVTMDLNAEVEISAKVDLKVAQTFNGWQPSCSGEPINNCVQIATTSKNVGKATFTSGTLDLNLFAWGSFNEAPVGSADRNVTHTSVTP